MYAFESLLYVLRKLALLQFGIVKLCLHLTDEVKGMFSYSPLKDSYPDLFCVPYRLLGKPALIEQAASGVLTYTRRPVFCHVMKDAVLVFTGFRKKSEVVSSLNCCVNLSFLQVNSKLDIFL